MPLVVDASIAAAWILPDESSEAADAVLHRVATEGGLAPDLLWHELRNILLMAGRRGRIPESEIIPTLLRLRRLPIETVPAGRSGDEALIALAQRHGLTAYDAAYLSLAIQRGAEIATADRALRRAATEAAIPLV